MSKFFKNAYFKEHLLEVPASEQNNRLCYARKVCTWNHIPNQTVVIVAPAEKQVAGVTYTEVLKI